MKQSLEIVSENIKENQLVMFKSSVLAGVILVLSAMSQVAAATEGDAGDKALSSVRSCHISLQSEPTQINSVEIKEKRTFAGGAESLTGVFELAGKGYSIHLSQQPSVGTARRTVSRIFLFTSIEAAKTLNLREAQFAGGEIQTYQGGPDGQISVETTIGCYLGACWTEYTPIHLTCD